MKELKVYVKLLDEAEFFGFVYLTQDQRLQDLLNDDRAFLPIKRQVRDRGRASEDVYKTSMINKSIIGVIEEV